MTEIKVVAANTPMGQADKETARLLKKASEGDQVACNQLYAQLDAEGSSATFVQSLTNTALQLRENLHSNLVVREAYRRKMQQMREELGSQTASPLERLLIERIVLCWLHLDTAELRYSQGMTKGTSWAGATFYEKSVDRAQKRYLAAVHSLALVRRLQIPAMQINVGEKQVNVVQGGAQANTPEVLPGKAAAAPTLPLTIEAPQTAEPVDR